jgi:hypothetical protein
LQGIAEDGCFLAGDKTSVGWFFEFLKNHQFWFFENKFKIKEPLDPVVSKTLKNRPFS